MSMALCNLTLEQLEAFLVARGQPIYRARQIQRWVYHSLATSFQEMTDLPASLRGELARDLSIVTLQPMERRAAQDGATVKVLFGLADGKAVEAVLMLYDDGRRTVCVSSQVGCNYGCPFCASGRFGLERNLTAGEMVEQVLYFARHCREAEAPVTNVVFMGMGEPLANYRATWQAVETLNSAFGLGARRITISTAGVAPGILLLAREQLQVRLSVSLHAANNALRDYLVPLNRTYPLEVLMDACRRYVEMTGRRITFEHVLIEGLNDSREMAAELAQLVQGLPCLVNLITLNPVAGTEFKAPSQRRIAAFRQELDRRRISNVLRLSRGFDIEAGCGQLWGKRR